MFEKNVIFAALKKIDMDAVFSFLSEAYPNIGWLIIMCTLVVLATKFYISVQDLRKKVDLLPCNDHKKILDEHSRKLDMILLKLDALPCKVHSKKINTISEWVAQKDKSMIPKLFDRFSPIRLKPAGLTREINDLI